MTLAGVLVAGAVLERLDAPRSVRVWMCLGYLFGLFYGNGDRGGLAGCVAGLLLGLASAKIAARKPLP